MEIKINNALVIKDYEFEDFDFDTIIKGLEIRNWAMSFLNSNPTINKIEIERQQNP